MSAPVRAPFVLGACLSHGKLNAPLFPGVRSMLEASGDEMYRNAVQLIADKGWAYAVNEFESELVPGNDYNTQMWAMYLLCRMRHEHPSEMAAAQSEVKNSEPAHKTKQTTEAAKNESKLPKS